MPYPGFAETRADLAAAKGVLAHRHTCPAAPLQTVLMRRELVCFEVDLGRPVVSNLKVRRAGSLPLPTTVKTEEPQNDD